MTSHPTIPQPAVKKGCSGVVVFMIAVFCLVVGLIAGVGSLYAYLTYGANALETLGLEAAAPPPPAVAVQPASQATSPQSSEVYALVYPIEETLRIDGTIDPASVRNRITTQRFTFQKCYQQELKKNPNLKGEISLQFTVSNPSGEIIAAVARQNTTGNEALPKCLIKDITSWKFAKSTGSQSVVRFDTLFLPISSARPPE